MKMRTKLSLAIAVLVALGGTGMAQTKTAASAPAAPSPVLQAPVTQAQIQPPAPAPAPAPTAAPVAAGLGVVPVMQPVVADPTESLSEDNLIREIARINARKSVIDAQMALDQSRSARERALLQGQLDRLKLQQQLANDGRDPAKDPPQSTAAAAAAMAAALVPPPPRPVVRSTYEYGQNAYAEIYVGANKVLARPGTVISATGHRVVSISDMGVTVVDKRGRRSVWPVSGSAGIDTSPSATMLLQPAGLPPAPPSN